MENILFTCMGTSDPVRGYRDGPMLHILRMYRPEKVLIFLTAESAGLNSRGNRIEAVRRHMKNNWEGYTPEIETVCTDILDPSDIDAVAAKMEEQLYRLIKTCPQSRLILNLSSGTPQMKQVLAMFATDVRYPNAIGVQVKNPEKAAGSTERTNTSGYSVEDELECNEDEAADAANRCSEPELLYHKRRQAIEQILILLRQRDYSAIYSMKNAMPDRIKALVGHLEARDRLQDTEARQRAQNLNLPFRLYPLNAAKPSRDYSLISEVYLVLLNRLHRQQYEELVLRLNPLVVKLQLRQMDIALREMGVRTEAVISKPYSERPRFYPDMLRNALPQVYDRVEQGFGAALREGDVSIELCGRILHELDGVDKEHLAVLDACQKLNESCRNALAHQLTALTAEQLRDACGMEPAQLLRRLGELIAALYPECDKSLFTVYKRCGDYIRDSLI